MMPHVRMPAQLSWKPLSDQTWFAKVNYKNVNNFEIEWLNGTVCSFNESCAPFSLPFLSSEQMPICQTSLQRTCFNRLLRALKSDQENHCKKLCNVKEFDFEDPLWIHSAGVCKKSGVSEKEGFVLDYSFKQPTHSLQLRSDRLVKTVKEEYYVISGMSLAGNIGGTLGMFIGFSFIGTSEWIVDVWTRMKNKVFWSW